MPRLSLRALWSFPPWAVLKPAACALHGGDTPRPRPESVTRSGRSCRAARHLSWGAGDAGRVPAGAGVSPGGPLTLGPGSLVFPTESTALTLLRRAGDGESSQPSGEGTGGFGRQLGAHHLSTPDPAFALPDTTLPQRVAFPSPAPAHVPRPSPPPGPRHLPVGLWNGSCHCPVGGCSPPDCRGGCAWWGRGRPCVGRGWRLGGG